VNSVSFLKKIRRLGKFLNALAKVSPALAGRAAFRAFSTPRRIPVHVQDQSFLAGATQSDFIAERIRIRVYEWKSKQAQGTVLLLHGWESNSARWRKFVEPLCDAGFSVYAFDAPAHGNSAGKEVNLPLYSRVIKAFMQRYGIPDALVGHSLGGAAVVMSMAAFEVPQVRKAVIMASFAESSRVMQDFGRLLDLQPAVLSCLNQEIERRSGLPIEGYTIQGKATLLLDVQGLVLHDRDDAVAPVSEGAAIAASWQARYVETIGLGHRMQDKAVVMTVVKFISEG